MKNRSIQLKPTLRLLMPVLLVCFALPPRAHAVVPPPDGGYPGANTAEGQDALLNLLAAGHGNTAVGWSSLKSNTEGNRNTAIGVGALFSQDTADRNTATGALALFNNTGGSNTATGAEALVRNTTGSLNVAIGDNALKNNDNGDSNTALGVAAGYNLTHGSGNVYIGAGVIGFPGESNTTRIRNVYPSPASARVVYVNSDNKIGTLMSSRRFKDEIKPMDKVSEAILALKPVSFRYKKEIEPKGSIMFGLIAEEVEKVAPELVTRDDKGEVETVRYDAVNAMLLNEFLKEHRKNEQQQATIAQLKSTVARQELTIGDNKRGWKRSPRA